MDSGLDYQKLHQSVPVTTQPTTPEQIRYFSKHATERNVFKWATTAMQTTHGFLAFAAWTAIYTWMFQNIPWLIWCAPFLAGFSLFAMHMIFRATWETFWYDRLDDDPNTDSPWYVPVAIIIFLVIGEVNGVQRFLTAQVRPPETRAADHIIADHSTTVASIEQSYNNDKAAISEVYKAKTAPLDRQIASLRNRSADTDQERRNIRARIAAIQQQRDQVLTAKAEALEKALAAYTTAKQSAEARREQNVAQIDTHNTTEQARYTSDLAGVNRYAWIISVVLLALIMMLSYRVVRINVQSGIIARRNYTVLDAHGNPVEVIWTALSDAFKRQWLRFSVGVHRSLSPSEAITSFDGTVIAQPGTYNTFPAPPPPLHTPTHKTETDAVREVMEKMLRTGVQLTPDQVAPEVALSRRSNGEYPNLPWIHDNGKKPDAPAGGPTTPPAGATTRVPRALEYTPTYAKMLAYWKGMVENQLQAYDRAVREGNTTLATTIQAHVMTDPDSAVVREGRALNLVWAVRDGEFAVRRRDREHFVPLDKLTEQALDAPVAGELDAPAAGEDDNLFKYDLNKFKQEIQVERDPVSGKVIGVKYKKADDTWGNIGFAQVKAFWNIYRKYADKPTASKRVRDGFEKWSYALNLFEEGREVVEDNLQTVMA